MEPIERSRLTQYDLRERSALHVDLFEAVKAPSSGVQGFHPERLRQSNHPDVCPLFHWISSIILRPPFGLSLGLVPSAFRRLRSYPQLSESRTIGVPALPGSTPLPSRLAPSPTSLSHLTDAAGKSAVHNPSRLLPPRS
jgi:hypothetical protein